MPRLTGLNLKETMMMKHAQLLIACVAGCCIGSAVADDHHMHHFAKDVDAFHSVLAPIWHAPQSIERRQTACAKASEMEGLAKSIRSTNASHLVGSVAILKTICQSDQAAVEAALGDVHEAFHHLIEHQPAGKTS